MWCSLEFNTQLDISSATNWYNRRNKQFPIAVSADNASLIHPYRYYEICALSTVEICFWQMPKLQCGLKHCLLVVLLRSYQHLLLNDRMRSRGILVHNFIERPLKFRKVCSFSYGKALHDFLYVVASSWRSFKFSQHLVFATQINLLLP